MVSFTIRMTPPTATAQQKGVFVRNGRAHFYKKAKVLDAENFLAGMIAPHAPERPLEGAVYFNARWCFPYRKGEKKGVVRKGAEIPHQTRPDLDNLEKNLLDVLTRLQFWTDDAQIVSKQTSKAWGPVGYLAITALTYDEIASDFTKGGAE